MLGIKLYIKTIKEQISIGNFKIIRRDKNIDFIRKYRLNKEKIQEILLDLTEEDFYKEGKEKDEEKYGTVPVIIFIKDQLLVDFNGNDNVVKIYIKLKVYGEYKIPVISFHQSEKGEN